MAVIERDVVNQGQENGNQTIDFPLARLGWIETDAEVKSAPTSKDYVALIDAADAGQMKKTPLSALREAVGALAPGNIKAGDGIAVSVSGSNVTISTSCPIPLPGVSKTLDDNSWDMISEVSDALLGPNYWSVGDCKAVPLKGTVGTLEVDATYYVYIIGFNHNIELEGPGITFGCFKTALTGGKDICLIDGPFVDANGTKYFNWNHWKGGNYGGWAGCDTRYDVLGSTDKAPSGYGNGTTTGRVGYDASATTATNPVANTLMAAFPSDLRAVMKPMTKYTDNGSGEPTNTAADISKTIDYLPLIAEFEIFGKRQEANQFEQNYQKQYAYYSAGNSRKKYRHSVTGSAACWWERSPDYSNANYFCLVYTNGDEAPNCASFSFGLAPAFKV